jgi:hypothetical protein
MIELKRTASTIEYALSGPSQTDAFRTHCRRLGATVEEPATYVIRATWETEGEARSAELLLQLAAGCGIHDHFDGTEYAVG